MTGLRLDEEICQLFGIRVDNLPDVCDSNTCFGYTDFAGILPQPIPIHGVLGDSHGALFGQGCVEPGMMKATYGTGSSTMMNIGENPVMSTHGVVTSLAWCMNGKVHYVLEGNLNYTGATLTWLQKDLQLIDSPDEAEMLAGQAVQDDSLYLIPAFSGLGAPYWDGKATAAIIGMSRTTRKAEIVRAGLECIVYQITDIIQAMSKDAGIEVKELCVDGGPTKNAYLMQFQSDIAKVIVKVPEIEELSGMGAAYMVGMALGLWDETIFQKLKRTKYSVCMNEEVSRKKYHGWKQAIKKVLTN
jgi:glycerol kinase